MSRRRSSHFFDGFRPGSSKHVADIYAAYGAVPDAKPVDVPDDMMWWDEDRVSSAVDRAYVLSHLRPSEARRLDQQLEFGDGLTDDTYMEWIENKAKRIFLILVDIGVPDQIFGVVDDSWDDDDLPIPLDQVERLQLTSRRDLRLEKKFFRRQFTYLLRHLRPGENLVYEDVEIVPLETVDKRQVAGVPEKKDGNPDKVCIPGRQEDVFLRRRIPLGDLPGEVPVVEFLSGIEKMRSRYHRHILSLWGSYIHLSTGYLLVTSVFDTTLRAALSVLPPSIKILAKEDRRILLLDWIHCLTEAVASLHAQGVAHGHIKPSNILLDGDNKIFLADSGHFADKKTTEFDKETYDYAARERPLSLQSTSVASFTSNQPYNSTPRKKSISTLKSPRPSVSIASPETSPTLSLATISPSRFRRKKNLLTIDPNPNPSAPTKPVTTLPMSPKSPTNSIFSKANIHRHKPQPQAQTIAPPSPPRSPPPPYDPLKADIYSLGCIYLELLTLLLKRKSAAFASHRSKSNTSRLGAAPQPTSSKSGNSRPGTANSRTNLSSAGALGGVGAGQREGRRCPFPAPSTAFADNASAVESWTFSLLKDAKKREDRVYRGVSHLLNLTTRMLAEDPAQRPSARYCVERTWEILTRISGLDPGAGSQVGSIRERESGRRKMSTNGGGRTMCCGAPGTYAMNQMIGGNNAMMSGALGEDDSRRPSVGNGLVGPQLPSSRRPSAVSVVASEASLTMSGALQANGRQPLNSIPYISAGSSTSAMGTMSANSSSSGRSGTGPKGGVGNGSGNGNGRRSERTREKDGGKRRPWKAPVYAGTCRQVLNVVKWIGSGC